MADPDSARRGLRAFSAPTQLRVAAVGPKPPAGAVLPSRRLQAMIDVVRDRLFIVEWDESRFSYQGVGSCSPASA